MSTKQEIATRFLTGSDIWSPSRLEPTPVAGYQFPARCYGTANAAPPHPQRAPKILLPRLLKSGDAKQATNAARLLSEFIQEQQKKLAKSSPSPRRLPLSAPPVDLRLWLDEHRYAAWTICGHLASIEEPQPGHGSSTVMLAEQEEIRQLLAVNQFIPTVIALYKGDDLSKGVVTRYMCHVDLDRALEAALERARAFEAAVTMEHQEEAEERSQPAPRKGFKPLKKSRFHPLGNFIIYQEPSPEDELPPFAIRLLGLPVPEAFESRRKAQRYIDKHFRRGNLHQGCKIARVLARAQVSPVMREGFRRPRDPEKFLGMVRKDPRIVEPELHVEWLPRYKQGDDGDWRLDEQKNRSTVRHGLRHILREDLVSAAEDMAQGFRDQEIRRSLGEPFEEVLGIEGAMKIAFRGERMLAKNEKDSLGISEWTLGPEWYYLQRRARESNGNEVGHWLRAPFESGKPYMDGLRSRIIELRIGDLAGLMDRYGSKPSFAIMKVDTKSDPKWVFPIT